MPYIDHEKAAHVEREEFADNVGALTYRLSFVAADYLEARGVSFTSVAEVSAALRATALEVERRIQAPYEDSKIAEAGRVDPFDRPGIEPLLKPRRLP